MMVPRQSTLCQKGPASKPFGWLRPPPDCLATSKHNYPTHRGPVRLYWSQRNDRKFV
jgi:hypothetical protein